jgi:hypothetical protein
MISGMFSVFVAVVDRSRVLSFVLQEYPKVSQQIVVSDKYYFIKKVRTYPGKAPVARSRAFLNDFPLNAEGNQHFDPVRTTKNLALF